MEAEIARLKQDLKKDKKLRTDLKKVSSKEWSLAETLHQRTEWLRSAGYQIDETEYAKVFVSDLHRSLWWRPVLLGVCFGIMGVMFARYGTSWVLLSGGGIGVGALSQPLIGAYRLLVYFGDIYEAETSLKIRPWVLPAMMITAVIGGFVLGMVLYNTALTVHEYTETGSISDKNWEYHFNTEDKTVTIAKYLGEGEEMSVPEKYRNRMVTCIGAHAFAGCTSLRSVIIPNSVTEIGEMAFVNCSGLTNVEIPSSVKEIGEGAFYNCTGLTHIVLPESLTEIKDNTFKVFSLKESSKLESIEIPQSVTAIGSSAFCNCVSLTSIEIPGAVTSIGTGAFSGCASLKEIRVSPENENYEVMDGVLFEKKAKSLICYPAALEAEEYIIPDGVETIGDHAFSDCWKLKKVRMPDSVRTIGSNAFYACFDLANIDIPQGAASIGKDAFGLCYALTDIQIPDSVETIGSGAFSFCESLTHIEIPESVTTIESSSLFCGCDHLTEVKIPDDLTEIGDGMFSQCGNLTHFEIPEGVTSIGKEAFAYCSSLTTVRIPESVVEIDEKAFYNCEQLSLVVEKDSYAEQYARDREISFTYA